MNTNNNDGANLDLLPEQIDLKNQLTLEQMQQEKLNLSNQGALSAEQKKANDALKQQLAAQQLELEQLKNINKNVNQTINQNQWNPQTEEYNNLILNQQRLDAKLKTLEEKEKTQLLSPVYKLFDDLQIAAADRPAIFDGIKQNYNIDVLNNPSQVRAFMTVLNDASRSVPTAPQILPGGGMSGFDQSSYVSSQQIQEQQKAVNDIVERQFKSIVSKIGGKK